MRNDSEEKILKEWNARHKSYFEPKSKLVFSNFEDFYRWLRQRAKWHGSKKKVDYYDEVDASAQESFKDDVAKRDKWLKDIKKTSREAWTEFFSFYERAKKLKKQKSLH